MSTQNARELFEIWYVKPLRELELIPDGAGAFIALATSCFLYERYVDALVEEIGKRPSEQSRIKQLVVDFGIDEEAAQIFWDVMRNGILHKGMPKRKDRSRELPLWRFHGKFSQPINLDKENNISQELQVQPWLFMKKVISLWQENLDILDRNDSFPWAKIL